MSCAPVAAALDEPLGPPLTTPAKMGSAVPTSMVQGAPAPRPSPTAQEEPVFLLAPGLVIEGLNAAAEQLGRGDGLFAGPGGRLAAADPRLEAELKAAVNAACVFNRSARLDLGPGRARGEAGTQLQVDPLFGRTRPLALLQLHRPERRLETVLAGAVRLYQLTPAEGLLLRALMKGANAAEFAAERGIKITTVRTQLASLYAKIGVAGNLQLVLKLLL